MFPFAELFTGLVFLLVPAFYIAVLLAIRKVFLIARDVAAIRTMLEEPRFQLTEPR